MTVRAYALNEDGTREFLIEGTEDTRTFDEIVIEEAVEQVEQDKQKLHEWYQCWMRHVE